MANGGKPARRATAVLRLAPVLHEALVERGAVDLYREVELPLVAILADMEDLGVLIDVEFLDAELKLAKLGRLADYGVRVVDSLALARELHPGKKNSLDALCERYAIDHSNRTFHGEVRQVRNSPTTINNVVTYDVTAPAAPAPPNIPT